MVDGIVAPVLETAADLDLDHKSGLQPFVPTKCLQFGYLEWIDRLDLTV